MAQYTVEFTDDNFKIVETAKRWDKTSKRWVFDGEAANAIIAACMQATAGASVDNGDLPAMAYKPKRKRTTITTDIRTRIAYCIKDHPELSDFAVAMEVGLSRNTIYLNPELRAYTQRCRECSYGTPKFNNDYTIRDDD